MGVTFQNRLAGGQRAKSAQGTIKILMELDFYSNLTPFLTNIGGSAHHWGAQPNIGVLGPSKEIGIKFRPF